jgi:hypothetical protein
MDRRPSHYSPGSLAAAIIGTELYSFIRVSFPIISGGSHLLPNWHVEAMSYELSEVMSGRTRRLIMTAPQPQIDLRLRCLTRVRSGS